MKKYILTVIFEKVVYEIVHLIQPLIMGALQKKKKKWTVILPFLPNKILLNILHELHEYDSVSSPGRLLSVRAVIDQPCLRSTKVYIPQWSTAKSPFLRISPPNEQSTGMFADHLKYAYNLSAHHRESRLVGESWWSIGARFFN